jgi:predicted transglutaminase-like cysteine proteinase
LRHFFGACLLVLLATLAALPAEAAGLFGTREVYSTNLVAFTKWDGVVARTERDLVAPAPRCDDTGAAAACAAADRWRAFIAELKALPLRERVERANAVLNRVRYVSAEANWHDADHWETPFEFLARGGQCQDYAIAKFMALEESGVPEEDLRFAVVRDTYLGADHAVAIVYDGGEALVLDNLAPDVQPDSTIARYVPYYSINRLGWWYHVPDRGAPTQVARLGAEAVTR